MNAKAVRAICRRAHFEQRAGAERTPRPALLACALAIVHNGVAILGVREIGLETAGIEPLLSPL
eukprot:4637406-Lingulodinium_polyedra.AAC.1